MNRGAVINTSFHKVLLAAANDDTVSGYTHGYYRYPARFSPAFVRAVIEEFSDPGDTILDPFLGGGTSLVEGLTLNRKVIGIDLNPIAIFVSTVKSTPLSGRQLELARKVIENLAAEPLNIQVNALKARIDPRFVNTPWWLRGAITSLLQHISEVRDRKVRRFLQCALLRASQWALDCRAKVPNSSALAHAFHDHAKAMCREMEEFRESLKHAVTQSKGTMALPSRLLLRSAAGLHEDARIPKKWLPVRLVITSPPYPGVHILYHRWQVRGRRETPVQYAIVDTPDGHGPSYFTLGGRHEAGLARYFESIRECYASVAKLMHPGALLIQLVSVANEGLLLPRLFKAIEDAGFEMDGVYRTAYANKAEIWRTVPHRKWYTHDRGAFASGRELILFHRPKGSRSS